VRLSREYGLLVPVLIATGRRVFDFEGDTQQ
jgi:hypothetical protein